MAEVTTVVTTPLGWAKSRPLVFLGMVLLLGAVVVRGRGFLYGIPVVGPFIRKLYGESAAK